ncbi:hypothetical protein ABAC460_18055 [Asticcacaulis sp. AC460]|uniref:GntR family transcriptional regulator n=1 Tax=Asticcacaulis sp. AC460 TaxID=1282360 RepID=UPI0003C40B14|nr:GntR family transcriptional regulator [Asticcacaulis sp. AC460]ESQ87832.1 hypothetical protein ABAC460_18055 [Asticcacaulis sp. AC460]
MKMRSEARTLLPHEAHTRTWMAQPFYAAVASNDASKPVESLGGYTAAAIEDALSFEGWPTGQVYGPDNALAANFKVDGRRFRQAVRLLEMRGVCRSRRGTPGGLTVLKPDLSETAHTLFRHLCAVGVTQTDICQARSVIGPLVLAGPSNVQQSTPDLLSAPCQSEYQPDNCALKLMFASLEYFSDAPHQLDDPPASSSAPELNADTTAVFMDRPGLTRHFHLATLVASKICSDVSSGMWRSATRLGSAIQLSDRYNVSERVITEAIRLLRDEGLLTTRRGRGGGVVFARPSDGDIMRRVFGFLSAHGLDGGTCSETSLLINIGTLKLICATPKFGDLDHALDQARCALLTENRPLILSWFSALRLLYDLPGNRILHLFIRLAVGFHVRQGCMDLDHPLHLKNEDEFRGLGLKMLTNIDRRDADSTVSAFLTLQALINKEHPAAGAVVTC